MKEMSVQDHSLARYIDQTLLKPEATRAEILKLCEEARKFSFYGVCVNSGFVEMVAQNLASSQTLPVAVVGFPLGAAASRAKAFEAEESLRLGAREIDMVLAIGRLKEKDYDFVRDDIRQVVIASGAAPLKVIIETSLLTDEEKRTACSLAVEAGAQFVKTSTGFNGGGATVADIQLMRQAVGPSIGVKASGGIKTTEQAWEMIRAGATRIGTSSGVQLVEGHETKGGY